MANQCGHFKCGYGVTPYTAVGACKSHWQAAAPQDSLESSLHFAKMYHKQPGASCTLFSDSMVAEQPLNRCQSVNFLSGGDQAMHALRQATIHCTSFPERSQCKLAFCCLVQAVTAHCVHGMRGQLLVSRWCWVHCNSNGLFLAPTSVAASEAQMIHDGT